MDFDDENDVRSTTTTTSSSRGSGSFASSSSSSISSRRRRRNDDASVVSVVRGAGAGAWAVQDAGTYQMLHDDCTYLCSTLLVSAAAVKLQSQALEAALDLAQHLQHRKTRSVLWQGGGSGGGGGSEREAQSASTSSHDEPETKRVKHTTTVLENILQVLSQAGKGTDSSCRSSSMIGKSYDDGNSSAASSVCGSPLRAGGAGSSSSLRTKSARRKLKQQSTIASNGGGGSAGGIGGMLLSPELKQVLACILYFLSWDCTLSEHHSVASMGKQGVPSVARKVRQTILEHGGALQGILRLTLPPAQQQQNGYANDNDNAAWESQTHSAPSTASAASSPIRKPQPMPSSAPSSPTRNSSNYSIVKTSKVRGRLGTTNAWDSGASVQSSSLHSSAAGSSLSSVSFQEDMGSTARSATSKSGRGGGGDPTAAGRRNRKKRKQCMPSVPEEDDDGFGFGLEWRTLDRSTQIMPPPPTRQRGNVNANINANTTTMSFTSEDTTSSFPTPASPPRRRQTPATAPATSPDRSIASPSSSFAASEYSVLPARLSQKLKKLLSKVSLSSNKNHPSANLDTIQQQDCSDKDKDDDNDDPWVSMVCLESINRIVTGKDEDDGSASCLEPTEKEEQDEQFVNPLLQTNVLLGKSSSGVVPVLGRSMSVSLRAVCQADDNNSITDSKLSYWHDRIAMLASLIDGACLFNKANRRGFAEEDPFSFEEDKQGLVYHILWLLHHSCRRIIPQQQQDNGDENALLSGIRLLALRTLTSLTHDNELAAEQMTQWFDFGDNRSSSSIESSSIRGIDVLAELVFELEGRGKGLADQSKKKKGRASDEELHRYDSTIFCLNTLANIIEAANVRRMLAEITVSSSSGDEELWLKWLCRWLVGQTETFRDAILGIGKETGSRSEQRELQKHEEDKLVAAGNSCVLLACLMTEPEEISEEPESTHTIRNLILEQMPRDEGSTGVTMIINTLKAFCNFYYCSLGDLSVAIVTPVKKLIDELDNLQKTELK